MRTLYRRFKYGIFDITTLPMEGKRKSNEHQERRGKQAFKRNISEREKDYPLFKDEFGHLARKSLNYQTPLEVFLNYIHDSRLSSLY